MKTKLFRLTSLFVALTMLAVIFLGTAGSQVVAAPPASVPAAVDAGGFMKASDSPEFTASTKVWTEAELAAAKPYPVKSYEGNPTFDISPVSAEGGPKFSSAALPEGAQGTALNVVPDFLQNASPLGYTYPPPFTRYGRYNNLTTFPYVTIGVLFFNQLGGSWRCSAASVGNYSIWTAGHCVHAGNNSGGGWSTNFLFLPAYKAGATPRGQWTSYNAVVLNGWFVNGDPRWDMGVVLLNTLNGLKISQRVGNLGFAANAGTNNHWFSIGYPAETPFNGNNQIICASSYAYSDANFGTPYPYAVGCDQTGGTSGGPRIWQFSHTASGNYVNGHNDYRYVVPDHPLELFSPYFGDDAWNLFQYGLSCNPTCP